MSLRTTWSKTTRVLMGSTQRASQVNTFQLSWTACMLLDIEISRDSREIGTEGNMALGQFTELCEWLDRESFFPFSTYCDEECVPAVH